MNFIKKHIAIIFLLLFAAVMRFTIADSLSYSNDELSALNRLNYESFNLVIEEGVKNADMHPAGVQTLLYGWTSLFGTGEAAVRSIFILCSLLSIWMAFIIGRKWFNKETGIIAATLITVLYFPTIHGILARPYSPGLLFSLLVGWYFLKLFFTPNKKWQNALLLGLSFACAMYTHYFAFMFVGFIGATGLLFLRKENYPYYLTACSIGILLFLPHLNITLHHLSIEGGLQWLGPPQSSWILEFLFFAFNKSWILIALLVSLLILSYALKGWDLSSKRNLLMLFLTWFFGIYLIGHVFSLTISPVLKFPVMLFAFPYLLILLGYLLSHIPSKFSIAVITLIFLSGTGSTIIERDLFGKHHFGLFKEIAEPMVDWNTQYGKDNIVTFMNVSNPNYLNYYAIPYGDSLEFDMDVIEFGGEVLMREKLLEASENYCIVGYSSRLTLPQVFETALEFYPEIIASKRYSGCAIFLLGRGTSNENLRKSIVLKHFISDDSQGIPVYVSDSTHLYGPHFNFTSDDVSADYPWYIKVSVVLDEDIDPEIQLTATFTVSRDGNLMNGDDGRVFWLGHDLERTLLTSKDHSAYFAVPTPDFVRQGDSLQISLWNRNGVTARIREFKVVAVEDLWN